MVQTEEVTERETSAAQHPNYQNEILDALSSNLTPIILKERIAAYHENDIAAALEFLSKPSRIRLYSILDAQTLANILEYAEEPAAYLHEMSIPRQAEVLSRFEAPEAAAYLQDLDKAERAALIGLMDESVKRRIALISSFDEDEIGNKMTTNYIAIRTGMDVREAMRALVDQAAVNDNISTLYVIDDSGVFAGAIDLKDLIVAREDTPLSAITMTSYPYVYADELIEDCVERLKEYSEDSIPVLDSANRLKGVLTSQDVTEMVDDAFGEDYARLAGLTAEEDLEEPLLKSVTKRLPWLIILLGLGLIVSSAVGAFEGVMAALPLIVSFQSLILDMSGNVGTQSLAVTIRVLMDDRVDGKEKRHLVFKEARIALFNGIVLGLLSFLFVGLYLMSIKHQTPEFAFSVSACTGVALAVSMLLSGISGTVIPLLFKKMNIDPAVASGPLITTINDLIAVVSYYGLAWLWLIEFMHI